MPDNKKLRGKADKARVALEQQHERRYLLGELAKASYRLRRVLEPIEAAMHRLRSGFSSPGFPAATKASKRRGK